MFSASRCVAAFDVAPSAQPDFAGHGLALVNGSEPGIRVLFIGNSYTQVNDLLGLVEQLAAHDVGAQRIFAIEYAPGGSKLRAVGTSPN